jgi:probable rRNA maturation factor
MQSIKTTFTVEVNVQDVFWSEKVRENPAISFETWQRWFQTWLETLYPKIPPAQAYEITLRLTDDEGIQSLNANYRAKNQPTDVLAFAALEVDVPPIVLLEDSSEPLYLGDIVISLDTASAQAKQQAHSLTTELAWLAAHGFLHLLGWDHPDEHSLREMLSQQETLLKSVGIIVQVVE